MAAFQLSEFKSALAHGGARPSLFEFSVAPPFGAGGGGGVDAAARFTSLCNVSSIPPLTVTPIERQYFGRTIKIPGDMIFGDLTTTIINTEDYSIRNDIEKWMNKINGHNHNIGISDSGTWKVTASLKQYAKDGDSLMIFTFNGIWPQTLSEIALSYDTTSDIEQFDVTWAYDWYSMDKGNSSVTSTYRTQT
jgi:hypothetical protein